MKSTVEAKHVSKFPLRLLASVRRNAEDYAAKEGVSLNQFINVAVAEKLAVMRHQSWLESRAKVTQSSIERALSILDQAGDEPPVKEDELPTGYISVQQRIPRRKKMA